MDKVKGTAKQAMNPGGMSGERDKIMRINQAGVQTPATSASVSSRPVTCSAMTSTATSSNATRRRAS